VESRLTDSCDDEIKIINGICEVFNELGYGYLESVYLRALEFELGVEKFAFDLENQLDVFFEGKRIGKQKINSVFNDEIWVCLTSTTKQPRGMEKKIRSILKSTSLPCAIMANLSGNQPQIKIIQQK
jgi:GxxExxY protein